MTRKTTFEKEIERNGYFYYVSKGTSMLPLIREGRDILLIGRIDGRLKKYDIPLYKRKNGLYVLHRIMKVRDKDYVLCGDNHTYMETGITDDDLVGVLTELVRNGKTISLNSLPYRLYTFFWCDLFFFRVICLKLKNILYRLINAR